MSTWWLVLYGLYAVGVIARILLIVLAFRKSAGWGLAVWFIPFAQTIFAGKHWGEAAPRYLTQLFCFLGCGFVFVFCPEVSDPIVHKHPELAILQFHLPTTPTTAANHKVPAAVDKARSEATLAMRDEVMQRQDAYDKHAAQVSALYARLTSDRAKLKGAGPAMTAFNARAAEYQKSLSSLAAEKTQLDAIQQKLAEAAPPAPVHAVPPPAGNLSATATVSAAPAEAALTRADMDNAVSRIRTIVNQVPPVVTKPPHETGWIEGYHPGATKPDFDHSNIVSGREIYDKAYIQMDGAPNVFYRGPECEFNSQTKFFYLSRTVPKKRLSEAEIQELVRLYRIVGRCERELNIRL